MRQPNPGNVAYRDREADTRFHWRSVIRLPGGLADRLTTRATGDGVSKNEIVIRALEAYLD